MTETAGAPKEQTLSVSLGDHIEYGKGVGALNNAEAIAGAFALWREKYRISKLYWRVEKQDYQNARYVHRDPITPYDYLDQDLDAIAEPPSAAHWFGTDQLGRDYLSRVLYGARTAVLVAVVVTSLSNGLGIIIGTVAAYAGGTVDLALMYLTDVMMCFPHLFFAILVNSTLKVPLANTFEKLYQQTGWPLFTNTVYLDFFIVFGALGLIGWPGAARMIRSQILSVRERDYVTAARTIGCTNGRIIGQYLIPNGVAPLIVNLTLGFAGAMIAESSLSYLGIGIRPPGASWGAMIADNMQYWRIHPHLVAVPGIMLAIVTLGINFLGDGLNDALNPRSESKVI